MSQCTKCDVCGRTTPDVSITFSKRKERWYQYWFDSPGGSYTPLDVCDFCWNGYRSFCQNRLGAKKENL